MKNRDNIIRYYKGTDNGALAARLIDLADSTDKGRPYAVSEFVSPGAVQIGETVSAHAATLVLRVNGGYEGAERVKLCFIRNDYEGSVDFGLMPAVLLGMRVIACWGIAMFWGRLRVSVSIAAVSAILLCMKTVPLSW